MDATWKKKWVEALRSGEYKQGKDFLRVNDTFCCLGVLCDLVGKEQGALWDYENTINGDRLGMFDGIKEFLPMSVMEVVGLTDDSPSVPTGIEDREDTLATFNDRGTSFLEIADLIEKHL